MLKTLKIQDEIREYRGDFCLKINSRTCMAIRSCRVVTFIHGRRGGSWLGYPPQKCFGKIFPPFKRVTLWQIPPLNLEKTLYSPPKSGQFFGFPPQNGNFSDSPPQKNFGCSPTYGSSHVANQFWPHIEAMF